MNSFSSQPLCRLPFQVKPCQQVTHVTHTTENIAFINKPTAGGKSIGIGSKCLSSTRLHTSSKPICRSKYTSDKLFISFFCCQYTKTCKHTRNNILAPRDYPNNKIYVSR